MFTGELSPSGHDGPAPWAEVHPTLRMQVVRRDDRLVVRLAGELDLASARPAAQAVRRLGEPGLRLVFDLSQVWFMDGAGVRFVHDAQAQANDGGWDVTLTRPHRVVRRLIALTGTQAQLGLDARVGAPPPIQADGELVTRCEEAIARALESGADMANVQLRDQNDALRIVAQRGFAGAFLDFFEVVDDEESACGVALQSGRPTLVDDVARSPIFHGRPSQDAMLAAGSRAVISVPIIAPGGVPVGMLSSHYREPRTWTQADVEQLDQIARRTQAAGAAS